MYMYMYVYMYTHILYISHLCMYIKSAMLGCHQNPICDTVLGHVPTRSMGIVQMFETITGNTREGISIMRI